MNPEPIILSISELLGVCFFPVAAGSYLFATVGGKNGGKALVAGVLGLGAVMVGLIVAMVAVILWLKQHEVIIQ